MDFKGGGVGTVNVYDFDGTIYKRDCSVEFYKYVIKKKPIVFFRCFFKQIKGILLYKLGKVPKEKMKERYFCFLKLINAEDFVEKFVNQELRRNHIAAWYKGQKKENDLIISASPYFLVKKFAERLEIDNVIASNVDMFSGSFQGKNCYGVEKIIRFRKEFKNVKIDCFYSDSKSDIPMAKQAEKAFLVQGNKIKEWKYL